MILDEILQKIEESGFKIALQKEIQLTREQAESFYKEHAEQPYYEELITKMTRYDYVVCYTYCDITLIVIRE